MIGKIASRLLLPITSRFGFATSHSVNYFQIANFSPETEELRKLVSKFADDVVAPLAEKTEKENNFPEHLWKDFGNLGLLAPTVDPKYGGSGLNYTAHCMMLEEISRASGAIGLSYGAHSALCVAQIARHCNELQKEKYLPKLCSGEHIGALAMSEVFAGSDVVSMKTTAVKSGNKYILNGSKMWITNGPDADVLFVYAKTSSGEKPGISCFLIEKGFKGFKCAQKLDKLGMRGSNTGELVFEDCEVPEENLVGQLNKGVYILMSGLDYERLVLAAGPVGQFFLENTFQRIMQAAFDVSLDYVKQRQQFGKKIGEFQIIQAKIADMYTQLQSSRAMVYAIANSVDQGHKISNRDCASLILYTSQNATQLALEALQCLGGNGYINDYPTGRFLRDAKLYEIGAGTNEIRRWLIGRELILK